MRTPQEAYNEAIQILIERHTKAAATIVSDKPSYQLGLHVAIEQLKVSFYGVFDQPVASTQELPQAEAQELCDICDSESHSTNRCHLVTMEEPTAPGCDCVEPEHAGDCIHFSH